MTTARVLGVETRMKDRFSMRRPCVYHVVNNYMVTAYSLVRCPVTRTRRRGLHFNCVPKGRYSICTCKPPKCCKLTTSRVRAYACHKLRTASSGLHAAGRLQLHAGTARKRLTHYVVLSRTYVLSDPCVCVYNRTLNLKY